MLGIWLPLAAQKATVRTQRVSEEGCAQAHISSQVRSGRLTPAVCVTVNLLHDAFEGEVGLHALQLQHLLGHLGAVDLQQLLEQLVQVIHLTHVAEGGQRDRGVLVGQPRHVVVKVDRQPAHLHQLGQAEGSAAVSAGSQVELGALFVSRYRQTAGLG